MTGSSLNSNLNKKAIHSKWLAVKKTISSRKQQNMKKNITSKTAVLRHHEKTGWTNDVNSRRAFMTLK